MKFAYTAVYLTWLNDAEIRTFSVKKVHTAVQWANCIFCMIFFFHVNFFKIPYIEFQGFKIISKKEEMLFAQSLGKSRKSVIFQLKNEVCT